MFRTSKVSDLRFSTNSVNRLSTPLERRISVKENNYCVDIAFKTSFKRSATANSGRKSSLSSQKLNKEKKERIDEFEKKLEYYARSKKENIKSLEEKLIKE